jgi:F0F1-type ATP synthase membrane subunit c/vacuolar-type H+-ATPase subunit K
MNDHEGQAAEDPARILRVMWLAFASAPLLYGVVVLLRTRMAVPDAVPVVAVAGPVLIAVALAAALGSIWWRRRYLDQVATRRASAPPAVELVAAQRLACLVAWAMSETVAIAGLVLALLSANPRAYPPFLAASLALFYLHRPAVWPGTASS